ncbi:MAG: hypothetical protein FJZ12_00740 [Candidatus Omnitrophica bacterium]|nr:hypothetical protein [Candidatus Omnitrophota bacterium]
MKKILGIIMVLVFVLISTSAFAESKGLHLGGLDKDTKKAQIEAKKTEQEAAKTLEAKKREAEKQKKRS